MRVEGLGVREWKIKILIIPSFIVKIDSTVNKLNSLLPLCRGIHIKTEIEVSIIRNRVGLSLFSKNNCCGCVPD